MMDVLKIVAIVIIALWLYVGIGNAIVALIAIGFRLRGHDDWFSSSSTVRWERGPVSPFFVAALWPLAITLGIPFILLLSWGKLTERLVDWAETAIENRSKTARSGSH